MIVTGETVAKESYDLCELENSNLRRCLAWAGKHLTKAQRIELAQMIRKPIDEGGVIECGKEQDFEAWEKEVRPKCVKVAELLREAIEAKDTNTKDQVTWFKAVLEKANWFGRAESLSVYFMEFDPPVPEATLIEIRNVIDG